MYCKFFLTKCQLTNCKCQLNFWMVVLNIISSIYFILTLQLNIIVNITIVIYYVSVKMLLNRWPGILCLTMGSHQDNRTTLSTMSL